MACQDRFVPLQRNLTITKSNLDSFGSEVAIEELPILPLRYVSHITLRELVDRSQRLTGYAENNLNFRYRWVCYSGTEVGSTVWMVSSTALVTQLHSSQVWFAELTF